MSQQPPIVVKSAVTPEFAKLALEQMTLMYRDADPLGQEAVATTRWELWLEPLQQHFARLADAPPAGALMMGLFTTPPHTIALFETPIRQIAGQEKIPVALKLREVMVHELQHRFGFNHLTIPKELGARQAAIKVACDRLLGDCMG